MSAISSMALTVTQSSLVPTNIPDRTAAAALNQAVQPAKSTATDNEAAHEVIRVSSSIGRAASAGQLSRQEALDIYRQIASFL